MSNNDDFVRGYIDCALWSSIDESGEPLDRKFDTSDIDSETVSEMICECEKFIAENETWLDMVGCDYSQHGHDFWLTRNHHGAGFWDRGYGDTGEILTDAAHAYGEVNLYVGDDGMIYQG